MLRGMGGSPPRMGGSPHKDMTRNLTTNPGFKIRSLYQQVTSMHKETSALDLCEHQRPLHQLDLNGFWTHKGRFFP